MKVRSFLAFDIPDSMKEELGKIIDVMSTKVQGIKWVRSEIVHCTVKFFGDVEEDFLLGKISKTIEEELKHQAPFKLKGVGIGVFPNWRYPRVIWAGLVGDADTASSLYQRLETTLEKFDLKKDHRKAFRLHLTLGRAKSKLKDVSSLVTFVEKQVDRAFGEFTVDRLTLYKSVLTKEGPIYTPLKEFKFGNH
jgi:2'-5' RNA ligase